MEDELLKRADDALNACFKDNSPKFLGFITESQATEISARLKNKANFCFYGGYEGAERTMLCVMPEWAQEESVKYPFSGITAKFRLQDRLSHRDFLGALMALGIKRETVGDILIEPGRAVIFLKNDILRFVSEQLRKVGSAGVTVEKGFSLPLPEVSVKKEISCTVASARIDSVVAALAGTSRSRSVDMISEKCVSVNSVCCEKPTHAVKNGDKISIKSCGKFAVLSLDGVSKKGRIILKAEKYI